MVIFGNILHYKMNGYIKIRHLKCKNVNDSIRNSESYKFINGNICDAGLVCFILDNYKIELLR